MSLIQVSDESCWVLSDPLELYADFRGMLDGKFWMQAVLLPYRYDRNFDFTRVMVQYRNMKNFYYFFLSLVNSIEAQSDHSSK